jgi:hypothetical protein
MMMAKAGTITESLKIKNPPGLCYICGEFCFALATHLKYAHGGMDIEEYYRQYPRAKNKAVRLWANQIID